MVAESGSHRGSLPLERLVAGLLVFGSGLTAILSTYVLVAIFVGQLPLPALRGEQSASPVYPGAGHESVVSARSVADRAIQQARGFLAEVDDPRMAGFLPGHPDVGNGAELDRLQQEVAHWESQVRASIREISGPEAARSFGLNDDGVLDHLVAVALISVTREYIERRIRRIEEWKATL